MNRKLLLIYVLFFISINTMAALASVDCKTPFDDVSVRASTAPQLECSNQVTEEAIFKADQIRADNFTNLQFSDRKQPTSGALSFILLIPALLVFVFSGFEKSNK